MDSITQTYLDLIKDFADRKSENLLYSASQLGKDFVKNGISPEEIVQVHLSAIECLLKECHAIKVLPVVFDSFNILLEVMMAYGMAYREYVEEKAEKLKNLKETNQNLKKNIDELSLLLEYSNQLNKINNFDSLRKVVQKTLSTVIDIDSLEIEFHDNSNDDHDDYIDHLEDCHTYRFPIQISGQRCGSLVLYSQKALNLSENQKQFIGIIVNQLAVTVERLKLYAELKVLSITDGKTGLYNYKYFAEMLKHTLASAKRYHSNVALFMIDIDNFKIYNDTCGHDKGDLIMQQIGKILRSEVRESDIAARFGGEEFAIILPNTDKETSLEIAERIRTMIKQNTKVHHNFVSPCITVSIGISIYPDNGEYPEALIKASDIALYQAKEHGKDRVISAYDNNIL